MNIFDEPKIDCHNHVFDPKRFPYQEGNIYLPSGQEIGTPAQFLNVLDTYGVRHALVVEPNSGYGTDNRCLLDFIARSGGRVKGVAVAPENATRLKSRSGSMRACSKKLRGMRWPEVLDGEPKLTLLPLRSARPWMVGWVVMKTERNAASSARCTRGTALPPERIFACT